MTTSLEQALKQQIRTVWNKPSPLKDTIVGEPPTRMYGSGWRPSSRIEITNIFAKKRSSWTSIVPRSARNCSVLSNAAKKYIPPKPGNRRLHPRIGIFKAVPAQIQVEQDLKTVRA